MSASGSALQPQHALSLLYLAALFWPAAQGLSPLGHGAVLDPQGRFQVRWGRQGDRISFLLEVQTLGYVGFGLSTTGAMASSDLVIGGVWQDGKPYLQDCFTHRSREVKKDPHQDYRLEYATENSTHTVLAFSRDLNTCDKNDKIITESTVRVIWAYHSDDVDAEGAKYHGSNRGRKSLRLLNPQNTNHVLPDMPYFNLTNNDVPIPYKDTTYWCQMFKMPALNKKHHVVKVEPVIQQGHENLVHHILLYECGQTLNETLLDYGHECYHPNMPDAFLYCETILFAWAIGGEGFTYPPHVGLSIGSSTDPKYVLMEVHYDNPTFQEGLSDSSGLRLFYTSHLRKHDAGVLETGVWVSLHHMIPPGMPSFHSEGHCTMECLEEALGSEKPSGIHVFAVLLHAHLAGEAITTRHFRNGEEQKMLAFDSEFDFNFQEFQHLEDERTILPGDNLITECRYNTKGRTSMTWGGLSTRDEMCLSYLLYYPRINLARCESIPEITEQLQFIGVKTIYKPVVTWPFLIKSPKRYNNLTFVEAMNSFQWSKKKGMSFNERILRVPVNVRCSKHESEEWPIQGMLVSPPDVKPYEQAAVVCPSSATLSSPSGSSYSLSVNVIFTVCITVTTVGWNFLFL